MSGSAEACESVRQPHALRPARLYPCGWRCDLHTPAALQGRPEPEPGPGWPAGSYLHLAALAEAEQSEEQEQS
ncbi:MULTISPECIES: hypothetical protein [unclassified Streptomyces]|uniref:hypothetical protein n=1 Tax=unclassified Streptomyces TaxID=2593676 RepID=UPI00381B49F0